MRTKFNYRLPIIPIIFVISILFVVGCTSGQSFDTGISTPKEKVGGSSSSNLAVAPEAATTTTSTAAPTNGQTGVGTTPDSPKLIKTADAVIEVTEGSFEKKFEDAKRVADKFGGHVTNSSANRTKGELISGIVTIRVPSKSFDDAITAVKDLGKVNSIAVRADDVSEEYVDLQSRLKNLQAQEGQLLAIMAKAQTVAEILAVQEQLTSVQGEIEVIKGRMQYLDNRVDFSTINITIQEPGAIVPETDQGGFVEALRTSAGAFLWTINAMIVLVGAALPVVVIIWLIVMSRRRFFKRADAKPKKNA